MSFMYSLFCLVDGLSRAYKLGIRRRLTYSYSNFMIAGIMEVVAEALVLAEKSGFGTSVLEQLIEHNFGALAYSDSKRMTDGVYMPRKSQLPYSDLNLAIKDVGHGISCAQSVGTRLPTGEIVMEHLQRAKKFST